MKRVYNLRKLVGNDAGAALIELALIAPVIALMVIGIVDMSNAFSRKLALEQGAQRAIEKIMQTTEDNTVEGTLKTEAVCQVNGLTATGVCKTAPITQADVAVTWRLECIDVSTRTLSSTQTSTDADAFDNLKCGSSTKEARYIEVAVNDKYVPMFPVHFSAIDADDSYHISATAGMRTQ